MATFIRGAAVPGAKAYALYDVANGAQNLIAKKPVERPFPFYGSVDSNGKLTEDYTEYTQADINNGKVLQDKFPIMQTDENGKCYYKVAGEVTITFRLWTDETVKEYENFEAYFYTDNYDDVDITINGFDFAWNDPDTYDYQILYIKINNKPIAFRTFSNQDYPVIDVSANGALRVYHADDDSKHTDFIPVANLSNIFVNDKGSLHDLPYCVTGFNNSGNNDLVMAFYNDASFTTATGTEITKWEAGGAEYISAETVAGFADGEYVVFFAKVSGSKQYANAGGIDFCLDDYHSSTLSENKTYQLKAQALAEGDTERFADSELSEETISYTKS